MDLLTTARSPWGESVFTHISWSLFWASLVGGLAVPAGAWRLHAVLAAPQASVRRKSIGWKRERAGLPPHITRHGFVARAFHWVMAFSMLTLLFTGVPADRRREVRLGAVALDGGHPADRVGDLPHRPRHVRAGLLVDLGRPEGHPGVQGRDGRARWARKIGRAEARQVSARQPPVSPRGDGGGPVGDRQRHHDDVAHPQRPGRAQSLPVLRRRRGA